MKGMKRILAMLLAVVLVVGLIPAAVFAAETTDTGALVDTAIVFSDLHVRSNDNINDSTNRYSSAKSYLTGILGAMKSLPVSSVTSGGDAFAVNNDGDSVSGGNGKFTGYTSTLTSYVREALGKSNLPVNYVWSDHDRYAVQEDGSTLLSKDSGFVYGAGNDGTYGTADDANYYIFSLSMADTSTSDRYSAGMHSNSQVTAAISAFTATAGKLDKNKPLLIVAHQPLLDNRNDNGHAYEWCTAINSVAENMDVVYLFGHNHQYDKEADYYYAKGSTMSVCTNSSGSATNVELNFTHVCAGYMNPTSTSNTTRKNVAVAVNIYEDAIGIATYNSKGVYTGSYAVNETFTRDHKAAPAPTVNTVYTRDEVYDLYMEATALGLTGITATYVYNAYEAVLTDAFTDAMAFEVALEGYTDGDQVTYTFKMVEDMSTDNLAVYHIGEDNTLTAIPYELVTEDNTTYITFKAAYAGVFAYGNVTVPEGYVLSELVVDYHGATKYWAGDSFDAYNLDVDAVYTKADAENFVRPLDLAGYGVDDGYEYTWPDMTTAGKKTITVTYGGLSKSFEIQVFHKTFDHESTGIHVEVSVPGATELFVAPSANGNVGTAVAEKLQAGTFVAYDIELNGYHDGEMVTVTLPRPAGVTDPAVYYVPESGAAVKVPVATATDSTVTFITDHFSTYVVGESTEIDVPDPENATGTGSTTTTTKKTVYVLVSSISSAGDYLIVNTNSATTNAHMLTAANNGVTDTSNVTIVSGKDADGNTVIYIENPSSYAVWTASTSGNGYRLYNSGRSRYLRYSSGLTTTNNSSNATSWTTSRNNAVYYDASTDRYIRYNSGWTTANSSQTVYIYQKQTVDFATTTTVSGTYSIVGNPAAITQPAIPGHQETLGSTLTFAPNNGATTTTDTTTTATYAVVNGGDPNGVISISRNTVTFTGKTGTALVKVSYDTNGNTSGGVVTNYITITATEPNYTVQINGQGDSLTVYGAENPNTIDELDLSATVRANSTTLNNAVVAWTSDNHAVATVDANGQVTFVGEGVANIQVSYTANGKTVTDTLKLDVKKSSYSFSTTAPANQLKMEKEMTIAVSATRNGNALNMAGETIIWTSSDNTIATVENGVVKGLKEGNVTITVKWTDPLGNEHTETHNIEVVGVVWTLELHEQINGSPADNPITKPVAKKEVKAGDTFSVWAVIKKDGEDEGDVDDNLIKWTSSNEKIATVDPATGKITFTGEEFGTFTITAQFVDATGNILCQDAIVVSATDSPYIVPGDGTNDFPEYPNKGSVRFDKTSTSVGNYAETGVALVELSMTGVPYQTGVDIVVVLDTSSSMRRNASGTDVGYNDQNSRYYIMKQALRDMLGQFKGGDVDLAIVDFNGYSNSATSANGNNYITGSNMVGDNSGYRNEANKGKIYTGEHSNQNILGTVVGGIDGLSAADFENTTNLTDTRINQIIGYFSEGSTGTNYDFGLEAAYQLLNEKKAANVANGQGKRPQFVIFMSDGSPFRYNGFTNENSDGRNEMDLLLDGQYADAAALRAQYSWMSADVAAMYNGNGTTHPHRMAEAIKGTPGTTYYTVDSTNTTPYLKPYNGLGATIYSIGFCIADDKASTNSTDVVKEATSHEIIRVLSSGEGYYWEDLEDYTALSGAFRDIAGQVMEATNVVVEDKVGSKYTVNFSIPGFGTDHQVDPDALDGTTEFYIQVIDYVLDENHERTNQFNVLENFTFNPDGTQKSHTVDGAVCNNCSHVTRTGGVITAIDGTYFQYEVVSNAANPEDNGEYLHWTAEKITANELCLQYFAYLDNSAGYEGTSPTPAGTYYTNEYATMTYTNVNGNQVQQEFPVPQMTWSGAQVSYVFYLVNENGQPVNKAGQVVPFAEAVYVTDVYTRSMLWNTMEQSAGLEAEYLAEKIVPEVYDLYDSEAAYSIHVYKDEKEYNLNNHFVLTGDGTTYVFNNKSDAVKYTVSGAYAADDSNGSYLCKGAGAVTNVRFEQATQISTENDFYQDAYYTLETVAGMDEPIYVRAMTYTEGETYYYLASASYTEEQGEYKWTPGTGDKTAGGEIFDGRLYYVDENGEVYVIVRKNDATEVEKGFDFSNTTVAFAVVWAPKLEEDTVVIDFGLDVVIDVAKNDNLSGPGVVGVRANAPSGVDINSGRFTADKAQEIMLSSDGVQIAKATVENNTSVRFRLDHQNGTQLHKPVTFYYESDVLYYDGETPVQSSMYSSVTVIPATNVYFEDEFVTFTNSGKATDTVGRWTPVGTNLDNAQAVDRPGVNNLTASYDANNPYGYDAAYKSMSQYSMGSAMKVTVAQGISGMASFNFYGTGFDVISMTDSATGMILVQVFDANNQKVKDYAVNTYYGYAYGLYEATYTYTCVKEATEATETTEATEAVYAWVRTGTKTVTAAGTDGQPTENPEVGDTYVAYETGWHPNATDNALYQVPVIKVTDLPYGKYTAKVIASYNAPSDINKAGQYNFYLDAIRVYDPTGVVSGEDKNNIGGVVSDAYIADGEMSPEYTELRNNIISANDFNAAEAGEQTAGLIFIDQAAKEYTIADYTSYGPNNELYLANGQAIAFNVEGAADAKDIQLGIKSANGDAVTYSINGESFTVNTATDMFYSIAEYAKAGTVVIENVSGGILSLTNIKITDAPAAEAASLLWMDGASATFALRFLSRSPVGDGSDSGENEGEDNIPEDNTNNNTNTNTGNTGNNGNADVEQNGTVSGETTAPESNGTVNDAPETDKPAEEQPEEELPKEETPEETPEEEIPEDSLTTGTVAEQLGFWARLWNAIKNAFKRLFTSLGF